MPEYLPFPTFLFRTPLLPVNAFFMELEMFERDEEHWKHLLQSSLIREAIFLASPVLHEEIDKFISGYLTKEKDVEKLKCAVLRYFSRMTSRCTPFGLFAGFSLGKFSEAESRRQKAESRNLTSHISNLTSQISLPSFAKYRRYTRLDMHYLCALAQDMGKNEEIMRSVKYYPNSSMYVLGEQLRYVEYFYKKTRRIHQISSVDFSEYLEKIINFAQKGVKFAALSALIVEMLPEENISTEEAETFIKDLIENQILVSDLEPEITGKDFLVQLQRVLYGGDGGYAINDIGGYAINDIGRYAINDIGRDAQLCVSTDITTDITTGITTDITHMFALLQKMDTQTIGKSLNLYSQAEELVKTTGTAYEKNYLFQVDMFKPAENATLNTQIADEIWEAIEFMNRITLPPTETFLKKFADNFYERYEEREMPLLRVLDVESGIGYPVNKGDISPLLEGYLLPNRETTQNKIELNRITSVLHKKIIESFKTGAQVVEFTEKDFDFLKPNWDDLPQTISCMCEIFTASLVSERSRTTTSQIYVHSAGGSSAANLLGRFCHVDKALEDYVKEITHFESSQNPEAIYAEIVHLPESRLGNILLRPVLREYEIPYLAKASVPLDYQIPLSDLFISVRQGKIVLRSKRLNKEIIPRLSTAHNYSNNAMPVYHFLCDFQTQGLRGGVGFNWGSLAGEFDFLPRAVYKNKILALATWKVKTADFKTFVEKQTPAEIKKKIKKWRKKRKIPQLVLLTEGDNELLVDFESVWSVKMLYSAIKKREGFELKEFLFDMENAVVQDADGLPFTNEFMITFYKNPQHRDTEKSEIHKEKTT